MPRAPDPTRRVLALAALGASAWLASPALAKRRGRVGSTTKVSAGTAAGTAAGAAASTTATSAASDEPPPYPVREDVAAWAALAAARQGWETDWVLQQLAPARRNTTVQRLIMPPPAGTAKNWNAYRDRFVEPRRIQAGLAFWAAERRWFEAAEARWGVPAAVVCAIIGVETFYGRITGNFRVLDALATLAFDFPTGRRDRSGFFRDELEAFLLWCRREALDPQQPRGSFAGAMGLPQFMPSSILAWGVDFDEDGHVDLVGHPPDAIGSVAHYLAAFGWEAGVPTHWDVAAPVDPADRAVLLAPDILPSFTPAQFAERGAVLPEAARTHDGLLAFVELQNGPAAPVYVAGTRNFWAITRYNWSSYYAMAVITLAEALQRAR